MNKIDFVSMVIQLSRFLHEYVHASTEIGWYAVNK